MKKYLLFLGLFLISITSAFSQQAQGLPIDPKIKYGQLDNGLTYYIRHNAEPRGQADFFLAQRTGSLQEEEHQRGLAHFLEHLAFKGTQHFPGNALFTYLEGIGVRFGHNLNAGVGFNETQYMIMSVPLLRETIIDSVLLILFDWTSGLALLDQAVEEERGVIREEWRTRGSAIMRIFENILPELFPNSLHGHRLPIGTLDVINNSTTQDIRDYYKKWYRPDHQAIVVVGDFDVDKMQARIHNLFGRIPTPTTPSPLVPIPVGMSENRSLPSEQTRKCPTRK